MIREVQRELSWQRKTLWKLNRERFNWIAFQLFSIHIFKPASKCARFPAAMWRKLKTGRHESFGPGLKTAPIGWMKHKQNVIVPMIECGLGVHRLESKRMIMKPARVNSQVKHIEIWWIINQKSFPQIFVFTQVFLRNLLKNFEITLPNFFNLSVCT